MTQHDKTVAITGASGFLGVELVRAFTEKGWNVVALVRNPGTDTPNVQYKKYDLTAPIKKDLLKNVQVLVHAAYVKYDKSHDDALDINLSGAQKLLAASRAAGVRSAIFISTMSAHDEAVSVYGKQKLAVERLFDGPSDTILRSGLIVGNGGIVKEMSDFMRSKHAVPLIGGGTQPLQIVGVYDLATIVIILADKPQAGKFVIATPHVYQYKDFYKALSKRLGIKVLYVPVPFNMLLTLFKIAAALKLPLGVGEDNLMGLKKLRAMDSAPDLKTLGVKLDNLDTVSSKTSI